MIWLILFVVATFVAAGWAFAAGYRGAEGGGPPAVRYEYRCRSCGTEVSTTDRLDGKCGGCWGRDFEAASERLERGD